MVPIANPSNSISKLACNRWTPPQALKLPSAFGAAAQAGLPPAFTISFLGSDRNTIMGSPSRAYIERRARAWGPAIAVNIFTDKDSAMALTYMKGPGRMAVLPSLVENSPLAILELMGASVPFIASTAGGIPELIHEDFRPKASRNTPLTPWNGVVTRGCRC